MGYFGRKKIFTDVTEITRDNVLDVLRKALITHWSNKADMEYLYAYYKGRQPVLNRKKEVRPEIKNMVVENRANEIVSFKVGYLMGEPIQYVSQSGSESVADKITTLNGYCLSENKAAKDKELADWFHICGTAYRMVLPNSVFERESDEAPFEIYTLDPRFAFVVYANSIGEPPVMGVKYIQRSDGAVIYSIYTKDRYFEIENQSMIVREEAQSLGIPIIEYPANNARLGAFEIVLPLLDAINTIDSNRLDGIEQFVQALMLFHNVDISGDDFSKLRDEGALKFKDIDPQYKAEIKYLTSELNQSQTQTLVDHFYNTVLTICGMPNRNGGTSTSDTGYAVVMRDGWSAAEARAKDSESMFELSEKEFLKLVLRICSDLSDLELKLSNIKVRFTRRNYENISQKATVLTTMLSNPKIAPVLAFTHCGMFSDPQLAYRMSMDYAEEQEKKAAELTTKQKEVNPDGEGNPPDPSGGQKD